MRGCAVTVLKHAWNFGMGTSVTFEVPHGFASESETDEQCKIVDLHILMMSIYVFLHYATSDFR